MSATILVGLSIWTLFTAILTIGVLGVVIQRRYFSSISRFHGPVAASFSTLWQIWHTILGDIEHAVMREHRKHGHFVRISHKEVSCSHPDSINAILALSHRKADWYQALAVPDKHHQTPMSELDPRRHRERSSITMPSYAYSYLMKSEYLLDSCIAELSSKLLVKANTGKGVELDRWLNYLAFDIIGELTFSKRFGFIEQGTDIGNSIGNMRFLMFYQTLMGYMYWLHPILLASPFSGWLGLKPHAHIFDTVVNALEKRKQNPNKRDDMVALWIANQKKYPLRMEEREILAVAGMTTIAGSETMTGALESVFYFMLRHPEIYAKLREELDNAQAAGKLSEIVQHGQAKELPYLQAYIKETLRYFPPVPFGLPRVAPKEGLWIGEQYFEDGTILSVNPYVIQHDSDYFGHDATSFNPERWFRPDVPLYEKYMIQFGTGYNGCPGKQFAYAEISKVAATLLRDFEFELVDKNREWKYRSQFTVVQKEWPVTIKSRRKTEH